MSRHDAMAWTAHASVEKWDADAARFVTTRTGLAAPQAAAFHALGVAPDAIDEAPHNLLCTAGLTRLMSLLVGAGGQAATGTATRMGLGNGTTAAAAGDTDLSAAAGSANRWFQVMDATFPSAALNVARFAATFGSGDGNFAWNEWGIDISAPTVASSAVVGPTLLNHRTSLALGTKLSGQVWALTVSITIT